MRTSVKNRLAKLEEKTLPAVKPRIRVTVGDVNRGALTGVRGPRDTTIPRMADESEAAFFDRVFEPWPPNEITNVMFEVRDELERTTKVKS